LYRVLGAEVVTLGLSVGQGSTEPKRKWSYWAGKLLYSGIRSRRSYTSQTISLKSVWWELRDYPQSESLARLMISSLLEQLRSCHVPERGMETKTKKCDREPNVWQEVRFAHSTEETCESRWREGADTL